MDHRTLEKYVQKLKASSYDRHIPNISLENARAIQELIRARKPYHILEIGTANGYSTLQFAHALEADATITTIESAWNAHTEAIGHFRKCKMKHIHAIWGDAKKVIPTLKDGFFDFIFIDGMKREYLTYLLLSLPKATPHALFILDDVEKFQSKMGDLFEWLDEKHIPVTRIPTDPDDSIMLIESDDVNRSIT